MIPKNAKTDKVGNVIAASNPPKINKIIVSSVLSYKSPAYINPITVAITPTKPPPPESAANIHKKSIISSYIPGC